MSIFFTNNINIHISFSPRKFKSSVKFINLLALYKYNIALFHTIKRQWYYDDMSYDKENIILGKDREEKIHYYIEKEKKERKVV